MQGFNVAAFKGGAVRLLILQLVMASMMYDSETEIHPVTNFQYRKHFDKCICDVQK